MIDVGRLDGLGHVRDPQPGVLDQRPALAPGREPDDDVDPRLVQVQGMGMTLAAIADDRHGLPGQGRRIASLS